MKFFDRLLTIVVTATLTSAIWIIFGSTVMDAADTRQDEPSEAAAIEEEPEALPSPEPTPTPAASPSPSPSAAAAKSTPSDALIIPVEGVAASALTDSFLEPRGENGERLHEAIDIMAPQGTPVLAAAGGRIAKLHNSQAGGRSIYVRSLDGLTLYFYAHLDDYVRGLDEDDRVTAGDVLGSVGSTGNASPDAPHLHFAILETTADAEWWEPANAINPYPLLAGAN